MKREKNVMTSVKINIARRRETGILAMCENNFCQCAKRAKEAGRADPALTKRVGALITPPPTTPRDGRSSQGWQLKGLAGWEFFEQVLRR
jgi:hypothetical protein